MSIKIYFTRHFLSVGRIVEKEAIEIRRDGQARVKGPAGMEHVEAMFTARDYATNYDDAVKQCLDLISTKEESLLRQMRKLNALRESLGKAPSNSIADACLVES